MSVKVAVIGDLHVKDDNYQETCSLGEKLIHILSDQKPDLIVVLGDTLHSFDIGHVASHKISTSLLRELKKIIDVVFLIGNHDLPSPNSFLTGDHFFTPMYEWNNFLVVDRKCEIFDIKGFQFAAVPYVPKGMFNHALSLNSELKLENLTAIFAHQEFIGCKMDRVLSTNGDVWPRENPLVISGHIHEYQKLGDNIVYVGTPRQSSFRDTIDKTISIFEFSRKENKVSWEEKRIEIGLPVKIKLTILASDVPTWIPPEGLYKIKLEITGTHAEIAACKEHYNIKLWKSIGIVITYYDIQCEKVNSLFVQPPPQSLSFKELYKSKISDNPNYIALYEEVVEGRDTSIII